MTTGGINFGDILDAHAAYKTDDDIALVHGARKISWPQLNARSNNLARALLDRGAEYGDKVGFYLRNQPEYMEGLAAAWKARLVHVNVNYRYVDDELIYIFDNSDSAVVFFDAEFREYVDRIHDRLPKVKLWVQVGAGDLPDYALSYDELAETGDGAPLGIERSADDMLFLYTGGTTGMPKGVMWTHGIWREAARGTVELTFGTFPETAEEHARLSDEFTKGSVQLPACPLMHGTGLFTAMGTMLNGGQVVTMENSAKFDPVAMWETVERNSVTNMAIVGDAFAKPLLEVLDANPGKYDLSNVVGILSSGVMWSSEVKRGLLKHMPQAIMADSFGSSESVGFGSSMMTADGEVQTAKFEIGPHCKVFSEDGREIEPGSDEPGFIARGGAVPLGYYKDEEKTAKTYKTINGVRYAIPGDWCTVAEDGTLTLLGRGSNCINSAGEKIYPEEVEEALKAHELVNDALVVGVPDEKWGQAVTAVVAPERMGAIDEDTLRSFVQTKLARYKAPKRILFKPDLGRAPNGKADYASIKTYALETLGLSSN